MMHALIALFALAFFQQTPEATLPPPSAHVALTAEGVGVQIYRCTPQASGTFQWVFEAPEAKLLDPKTFEQVGMHTAGPTWHWSDGSEIVGKLIASAPSHDPTNIAWLLLETHSTGEPAGVLANVVYVRRSNTQAGAAPAYGCDAERQNNLIRVPYEATYTFYTAQ